MIGKIEDIANVKTFSKPQSVIKQLLNGDYNQLLQMNKNSRLLKRLGATKANNEFYNPIQGA